MTSTKPDAGLLSLDHYKTRLPLWRYRPRQKLIPIVRLETPYLAWLQQHTRSPTLDSYFAITANLGTHTAFIIVLPLLFWFGYTRFARALVHILAAGVYSSGFVKDLLCLPRPLSPPLQRITMSGSAALEYGFPSTHSTNAMSVAVYTLLTLHSPDNALSPAVKMIWQIVIFWYTFSIVFGRMYCGMHGFFDCIVGCLLGAAVSLVQWFFGDDFDNYVTNGPFRCVLIVILIVLFLVRIHPEPADDCPCFDDSVCFSGVLLGVEIGNWHFSRSAFSWSEPVPATVPYRFQDVGLSISVVRLALGVVVIFLWREFTKPLLLRYLPPLFRVLENYGANLPRRFFTTASNYEKIPRDLKVDNVMPSVSELPTLLGTIRHPRRRAVSIGPQSEADAYETLAYREQKRRQSTASPEGKSTTFDGMRVPMNGKVEVGYLKNELPLYSAPVRSESKYDNDILSDGTGFSKSPTNIAFEFGEEAVEEARNDLDEEAIFCSLEKPRVRYDVEVVTKLIVYSGVAWIAVEGNPILFQLFGLGL